MSKKIFAFALFHLDVLLIRQHFELPILESRILFCSACFAPNEHIVYTEHVYTYVGQRRAMNIYQREDLYLYIDTESTVWQGEQILIYFGSEYIFHS